MVPLVQASIRGRPQVEEFSMTTQGRRPMLGAAAIALAILFNAPFSILAATYNYPDVLRGDAADALTLFAAGGPSLILTWHAFALTALAFAPLAVALSVTPERLARHPALSIGAAVIGALAGVMQAVGLWRWVFVVPMLARDYAAPGATDATRQAAEQAFAVLNQYGGVAIGEHLGQLLTAAFACLLSAMQWTEARKVTAVAGFATAGAIAVGTGEGLAIALGHSGETFGLITIGGFLGLTVWLILTGLGLMRSSQTVS
jgi:hypothetical protein